MFTVRRLVTFLLFVLVATAGSSLLQWRAYEQPNRMPRLRSLVGKRVTLPAHYLDVASGEKASGPHPGTIAFGPYTGTLAYVGYRFNDAWGWFDLEVRLKDENADVGMGLSPEEADQVILAP